MRTSGIGAKGRTKLTCLVVDDGWPMVRVAERFQCSPATVKKWVDRYSVGGPDAMKDRSSRAIWFI